MNTHTQCKQIHPLNFIQLCFFFLTHLYPQFQFTYNYNYIMNDTRVSSTKWTLNGTHNASKYRYQFHKAKFQRCQIWQQHHLLANSDAVIKLHISVHYYPLNPSRISEATFYPSCCIALPLLLLQLRTQTFLRHPVLNDHLLHVFALRYTKLFCSLQALINTDPLKRNSEWNEYQET